MAGPVRCRQDLSRGKMESFPSLFWYWNNRRDVTSSLVNVGKRDDDIDDGRVILLLLWAMWLYITPSEGQTMEADGPQAVEEKHPCLFHHALRPYHKISWTLYISWTITAHPYISCNFSTSISNFSTNPVQGCEWIASEPGCSELVSRGPFSKLSYFLISGKKLRKQTFKASGVWFHVKKCNNTDASYKL